MGSGLAGGPLTGGPTTSGTNLTLTGTLTANAIVDTTTFSAGGAAMTVAANGDLNARTVSATTGPNGLSWVTPPTTGVALDLDGRITDGATAVGTRIGAGNALSTVGSKVVGFYSDLFSTLIGGIGFRGTLFAGAATIPTTQGTPGSGTLNSPRGKSAMAAGQTTCTITNDQCTAESVVHVIWEADPTGTRTWVVVNPGNFVVTLAAAPAGNVNFRWYIVN